MGTGRRKILLFAFTCNPYSGSESRSGWERALEISKQFETWVVTEQQNITGINRYTNEHGCPGGLHILYVSRGRFEERLMKLLPLFYLDYNIWHRRAYRLARILHQFIGFDLAHQLTICGFREPGYLHRLGIPYIWGPVGGMQYYPWRFLTNAGIKGTAVEAARNIANFVQFNLSLRIRKSLHSACAVLASNSTQQKHIERTHNVTAAVLPEAGITKLSLTGPRPKDPCGPLRILWSGKFQHRKALHLLINALSRLPNTHRYELRVLGSGPMEKKWRTLAEKTGVEPHCAWLGWLPHREAVKQNEWADIVVFTSLSDTTGAVVLEALSHGVPVICFNHQGAGDVVTSECGVKIQVTSPKEAVSWLRTAIAWFCEDKTRLESLSSGAYERAEKYLWSNNCRSLFKTYDRVLWLEGAKELAGRPGSQESGRTVSKPSVSIIVINQNRAAALKRCLDSIEMQSYRPLEIVVLDHGSSDNSPAVIKGFSMRAAEKGIRVKYITSELMGVAASRNHAAGFAEGEILCFIDNDACLLRPDDIDKAAGMFMSNPSCGLISFRILKADTSELDPFAWVFRRPKDIWSERSFKTFTFAGGGFCIRREAFFESGGFWGHLTYSREEEDLGMALIERGWELFYYPAVTIRHYFDTSGRSSLDRRRQTELRNGLMVLWRRFPVPIALPAMCARIITMALRNIAREKGVLKDLLLAVPAAAADWRANRLRRTPISMRAAFKYFALHLTKQKAG